MVAWQTASMVVRGSCVELVGRRAELGQLEAALDRAIDGEPSVLLVGGDAGVGKSRLLVAFTERAERREVLVLCGGCLELGDGGLPYAAVTEALRDLPMRVGAPELRRLGVGGGSDLARLIPMLRTGDPTSGAAQRDAAMTPTSQLRLFEALLHLLTELAANAPVLLVVEDAHWADASTRDLLVYLAHNLRDAAVLLVVSYRTDDLHRQHPLRLLLPRLAREDAVEHLPLAPLERAAFDELLEALLGEPPGPERSEELFRRTAGNPFFAEQLVQAGADPTGLPDLLRDVLLLAIDDLDGRTVALLRIVAAAGGEQVGHELLARVSGLDEDELNASLRTATQRGVLVIDPRAGTYGFRHALLGEAVDATLLPGERGRIHGRLATAIDGDARLACRSASAELAHHWHLAQDQPRSLVASLAAARDAESSVGAAEALVHVERALELWPRVDQREERTGLDDSALFAWAARLCKLVGRAERALALQEAAIADLPGETSPSRRALLHGQLGQYRWDVGDGEGAVRERRRAVELVPAQPPSRERARALAKYSNALSLTSQLDEAGRHAREALAMAQAVGDREVEGHALGVLGSGRVGRGDLGGLEQLREARRIATALGADEEVSRWYHNEGAFLLAFGHFEDAIAVATAGLEHDRATGAAMGDSQGLYGIVARAAFRAGRWQLADATLRTAPQRTGGIFTGLNHLLRANLAACRGQHGSADAWLQAARRLHVEIDVDARAYYLTVLLTCTLLRDGSEAVRAILDGGMPLDRRVARGVRNPDRIELCSVVLRALADEAAAGRPDRSRAETFLAEAQELEPLMPEGILVVPAWLALATAEHARATAADDTVGLWEHATARCEEATLGYHAAYARFRHAQALLDHGHRPAATDPLRRAHATATQLGAAPLADAVVHLARRANVDLGTATAPSPAEALGLTPREAEVLALVAAGRSNPEIAETLYITAKTASVHVSNILRKLSVASRGEAAALAHRRGLTTLDG
jgi:DNA-binding CsgD family transcriptional regulator/tetratricopeptide (TPR) repeat protein